MSAPVIPSQDTQTQSPQSQTKMTDFENLQQKLNNQNLTIEQTSLKNEKYVAKIGRLQQQLNDLENTLKEVRNVNTRLKNRLHK